MAPQQIAEIEQLVAKGQTEEQVYAIYEKKFGARIHAVPKAEGFNLLAWILPFVGLLFGLGVVVLAVKRLQREAPSQSTPATAPEISEKYRKLLERELTE
jgi:cytochrome c-type biogenesis protein CcmH